MVPAELDENTVERMVFKGARLACIVHGDGGLQDVTNLIAHLDIVELRGLTIALAALVNTTDSIGRALDHASWDPALRPLITEYGPLTIAQLAQLRRLRTGEIAA